MIFQRRFHSHTPTSVDSPPTPPPKDVASPAKTLEEILAIVVSPRAPKPPPHAVGTVASNSTIIKNSPSRSASSPLKSNVPRRAPSSRKTGHNTIQTDAVDGHDAFESDAFAVHMPTTRIPIIEAPVPRTRHGSPTQAQAEAVQTYKEKAEQARERNNNVGVRIPYNIASYDYAYKNTPKKYAPIPASLKPSSSPPAPVTVLNGSPSALRNKWTQPEPRLEPSATKSKFSSNTSVYRKPTILGVTTAAAVIEESVQYVRADANGGASRPTSPPKGTTVKISLKPKSPSPVKAKTVPAIKVEACESEPAHIDTRPVEHCRGIYYRPAHVESRATSRSPSPTKTMPNFARQYSVEGDSIFGYKVKDSLGTSAGANNSSSSEDEKPKVTTRQPQNASTGSPQKRTLTDRWPWIRKGTGAGIGKPPSAPAPDPPMKRQAPRRPKSIYVSPFDDLASPPTTPPPIRSVPLRPAAVAAARAAATTTTQPSSSTLKVLAVPRKRSATPPATSVSFDDSFQQIQSCFLLALKICLAVYAAVALWFILDAVREALFVVLVPLQLLWVFTWAVVCSVGNGLGVVVGSMGGKIRMLAR